VSDHSRIEELRRRVQRDPASIAFAQLAEEHRRAGQLEEAIGVARNGLMQHPAYLSARVTLGRALLELGQLDEAAAEFEFVVQAAPDNLTAVRQLAEIHQKRRHLTNETKSRMPQVASLAPSPAEVTPLVAPIRASSSATAAKTAMEADTAKQPADTAKQQIDTAKQQIDTAKQQIDTAKQQIDTAKQQIDTAKQPPDTAQQQIDTAQQQIDTAKQPVAPEQLPAPSHAPRFVVELTSQTAHIGMSPSASSGTPAVGPVAVPPLATPSAPSTESVAQGTAKPAIAAPLDPVIAELEAWLAVLEEERAARMESPHAGH
jgi:tetratricopeptide (TPR) repeat protein